MRLSCRGGDPMSTQNIWLYRYSILLAACTLLLLAAGASVTTNEAGLSVPDWPLSYGKLMPEMVGGVFYEHGHRMIATAVGALTVVLAVWLWRSDSRRWVKILGWAMLAAVIVQGVLGGVTVLLLLPKAVSISHACLAQAFLTATMLMALFHSPGWRQGPEPVPDEGTPSLRTMAAALPAAVFVQIFLGAAYRHRALELMPHVVGAIVVSFLLLLVAVLALQQYPSHQALRRSATALIVVTFVQVVLGIAAYLSRISLVEGAAPGTVLVWLTMLHLALGAVTLGVSAIFSALVFRHVSPQQAVTAAGDAAGRTI